MIQWALVALLCSASLIDAKYRFRFHTCIKEDQKILDRENLVSLRQVAFIDDGSFGGHKHRKLSEIGIGIQHGSMFKNANINTTMGSESTIHFIDFYDSQHVIVINFWTRQYYFEKKGGNLNMRAVGKTIQPNFKHFVRVYFICAPGNARSALILFGDQAKLRSLRRRDDVNSDAPPKKTPSKTTNDTPKRGRKRRIPKIDEKIGDSMKKCRRRRRQKRAANPKRKYPIESDVSMAARSKKDDRRMEKRALYRLFNKILLVFAHFGFGVAIVINCIVLAVFFHFYKKPKTSMTTTSKSRIGGKSIMNLGGGNGTGSTTTGTTKTKSEENK